MYKNRFLIGSLVLIAAAAATAGVAVYLAVMTRPVALSRTHEPAGRGTLLTAQSFGRLPAFVLQFLLNQADLPEPITVPCGITLYRVTYRTALHDGTAVTASGLVSVPWQNTRASAVAYFHGTNAQRYTAPSQTVAGEGALVAAAAAATGQVMFAPDYVGLGTSREPHPYLHADSAARNCLDFLKASSDLLEQMGIPRPQGLYLLGFSQGGHTAFAVQRALESMPAAPFRVLASATVAGPFYLQEISFPHALQGSVDSHVYYLAYLANSYASIYRQPIGSLLASPYSERVPVLFDGDHESDAINAGLPAVPRDLFTAEFLAAYDTGTPHWFPKALAENEVHNWKPAAPIRAYYGDADLDVSPEEARRVSAEMSARGASVEAVSLGPLDHNQSARAGIPKALRWFAEREIARTP